jgi:hypothetical protein
MVRDTKDQERGPMLRFTAETWEAFTRSIKQLSAKWKADLATVADDGPADNPGRLDRPAHLPPLTGP